MGFRTKQVHAGVAPDPTTGAILTPIHQSTTFVQESVDEYMARGYSYSRAGNPTVRAFEEKLTALEGGLDTTAYGSGMAATVGVFLALLKAGDHVVIGDVVYGGTYRFADQFLRKFGVEVSFVDAADLDAVRGAIGSNTRLVFTESPANPTLKLTDLAAVSEICEEANLLHVTDNTFLTPYYQRPFELGADVIIHSTTKFLDGHNATLGGAVVVNDAELHQSIAFARISAGLVMSPMVAWLTLQGTKTLSERMDRQSANAMEIATWLEGHSKVDYVNYPGFPNHPQHALATSQASGFGAMVCFEVTGGVEAGKRLMDSVELWTLAENLGAVESLITHPVTMTHAAIPAGERAKAGITDGLVRLSVGLEDADDLIAALDKALQSV
ncbi:MAG: PLP-dependent aspartate aminotransferase family protein [Acidimicrobiia bacterium]|nr:PLP-dependent aspartate aminotransferase family protein [Acidimicrobiia bacterium]MDH3463204.1 PLP-dependent aspartate aminotransferase family protein [Acidimicrobiia bacterium]